MLLLPKNAYHGIVLDCSRADRLEERLRIAHLHVCLSEE